MFEGVSWFFLLIVLKDSKAKADILSEGDTAPDTRRLMDAGRLRAKPDKEVRGDIGKNSDADTIC
jgi:hypothetical protein